MKYKNGYTIFDNIMSRNPTNQALTYYGNNIAPHAETQRALYTVPAGKMFWVDSIYLYTEILTAAAPAGFRENFYVSDVDAQAVIISDCVISKDQNTIGNNASKSISQLGLFLAGTVIEGKTLDIGTGGTLRYYQSLHGIEFDEY